MPYKAEWYPSPLDLPEGKSGPMEVRHRIIPPGAEVKIVGTRQAILRGIAPVSARLKELLRVHELVETGVGTWMTDLPEELNQIGELLYTIKPRGRVLIGGLGLGILAKVVSGWPGVRSVTVIENSSDVIKLCARPGYVTIEKDIKTWLAQSAQPQDFYLLDTWQGTNEGTWWDTVMPMRRLIRNRWGRKPVVHCWAEDIMRGQIVRTLMHSPPHWYYRELPLPMNQRDAIQFVSTVGLPAWERRFGAAVDKVLKESDD